MKILEKQLLSQSHRRGVGEVVHSAEGTVNKKMGAGPQTGLD